MVEMDALMDEWKARVLADNPGARFSADGIVSPEHWHAAPCKVLFLLKESNGYVGPSTTDSILRALTNQRSAWWRHQVLRRVAQWAYGLQHYGGEIPPLVNSMRVLRDVPLSIAYVNMKKTPGSARTAPKALEKDIQRHGDLLRRQVELIAPEVVVLCGTYWPVKRHVIPELQKVAYRTHAWNDILFFNAYHPAFLLPKQTHYDQVMKPFHAAQRAGLRRLVGRSTPAAETLKD